LRERVLQDRLERTTQDRGGQSKGKGNTMKRQDRPTLERIEPTGQVGKDRVELGRKGKKSKRTKRTRRKSCWGQEVKDRI
jgi:hypothetical protein